MFEQLQDEVKKVNGRRRTRILDSRDIEKFIELVSNASDDTHTIRLYSPDGFVANSYKYWAEISYLQADRQEDGTFNVYASTCDAKRSNAAGSLITINGRAI